MCTVDKFYFIFLKRKFVFDNLFKMTSLLQTFITGICKI